jgi:hypothetical protein
MVFCKLSEGEKEREGERKRMIWTTATTNTNLSELLFCILLIEKISIHT